MLSYLIALKSQQIRKETQRAHLPQKESKSQTEKNELYVRKFKEKNL